MKDGEWTDVEGGTKERHWLDLEWGFPENDSPEYTVGLKFDGCVHFNMHFDDGKTEYLHICDLEGHIEMMQKLLVKAKEHFGDGWPE